MPSEKFCATGVRSTNQVQRNIPLERGIKKKKKRHLVTSEIPFRTDPCWLVTESVYSLGPLDPTFCRKSGKFKPP